MEEPDSGQAMTGSDRKGCKVRGRGSCLTLRAGTESKWVAGAEAGLPEQAGTGQGATRQAEGQGIEKP